MGINRGQFEKDNLVVSWGNCDCLQWSYVIITCLNVSPSSPSLCYFFLSIFCPSWFALNPGSIIQKCLWHKPQTICRYFLLWFCPARTALFFTTKEYRQSVCFILVLNTKTHFNITVIAVCFFSLKYKRTIEKKVFLSHKKWNTVVSFRMSGFHIDC